MLAAAFDAEALHYRLEIEHLLNVARDELADFVDDEHQALSRLPALHQLVRTLGEFVRGQGTWDSRQAYLGAMREWLPRFATIGQPISLEDLVLFGDCYYLPHEEGPEANALCELVKTVVGPISKGRAPSSPKLLLQIISGLRTFCARMTELRDRSLFYALSRRVWELREELDLLEQFVRFKCEGKGGAFRSDSHLPGTYRGGMVARLQRLFVQQPDGAFTPAVNPPSTQ